MMRDNKQYNIEMHLTTPAKQTVTTLINPEEVFSYNTTKNGEFKLCFKIATAIYDDVAGIKSVKTKLFFSNEYYNCK